MDSQITVSKTVPTTLVSENQVWTCGENKRRAEFEKIADEISIIDQKKSPTEQRSWEGRVKGQGGEGECRI